MLRAILIAAFVLLGQPAWAQSCHTVAEVTKDFLAENPGTKVIAHLTDENALPFMAAANEGTQSNRQEKEVLVIGGDGFLSHVVLFTDGCATGVGNFPADKVDKWLHGVVG